MKKNILLLFLLICTTFISCGNEERNDPQKNEQNSNSSEQVSNGNNQENVTSYITQNDLNGVWSVEGNRPDLYFIWFTETGKYSFCFNSTQMGSGTYSLDKNSLTLNNTYLNTKDVLKLEQDGNSIKISGEIYKFKSNSKEPVNIRINKTNKQIPITKTGEKYTIYGLHVTYGSTVTYIRYISENLMSYQECKDNSLKQVLSEKSMFYVINEDMTYTQECLRKGDVIIYKIASLKMEKINQ